MRDEAENLRARAEECRWLSGRCRTTETHDLLLKIASGLEEEAVDIDAAEAAGEANQVKSN